MKTTLILIFILFWSCIQQRENYLDAKSLHNKKSISKNPTYKVYKIDSVNNFYLIYAIKKDTIYKIVSKKEHLTNCNTIKKNFEYEFKLHSRLANRQIGNMKILPQNLLLVNCFGYDDSTNICLEGDSIRDLFSADNIKGLCFEKK